MTIIDRRDEDILRALRRISRAIDLHSRKLVNTYGLTSPQLVCLRAIQEAKSTTPSALARAVSLSQGTVTGIIDRLYARQLVNRERISSDRRVVTVTMTDAGEALVADAPSPLQEKFVAELNELSAERQQEILVTLDLVASMMGGATLEAAPVLSTASGAQSQEEAQDRDMLDGVAADISGGPFLAQDPVSGKSG